MVRRRKIKSTFRYGGEVENEHHLAVAGDCCAENIGRTGINAGNGFDHNFFLSKQLVNADAEPLIADGHDDCIPAADSVVPGSQADAEQPESVKSE